MALAYGTAEADLMHTARVSGVPVLDASHAVVSNFGLTSASGTDEVNLVPEPGGPGLLLAGLGFIGWRLSRNAGLRRDPEPDGRGGAAAVGAGSGFSPAAWSCAGRASRS